MTAQGAFMLIFFAVFIAFSAKIFFGKKRANSPPPNNKDKPRRSTDRTIARLAAGV